MSENLLNCQLSVKGADGVCKMAGIMEFLTLSQTINAKKNIEDDR